MERLTPNQKSVLARLVRMSGRTGRWVSASACGQRCALEHIARKGYADERIEYGPRGGEHRFYLPTPDGIAAVKRAVAAVERKMPADAIDTQLIEARKHGRIVRVICGGSEYRGVPGEVERDGESGRVYLRMGLRLIPLMGITEVIT